MFRVNPMIIGQSEEMFPTDDACNAYLTNTRCPDGIVCCRRCGNGEVNALPSRPFHWQGKNCGNNGYRFPVLVKRGVIGIYHKVGAKYLPLYVAKFQFRYNNRKNGDIFGAAPAEC